MENAQSNNLLHGITLQIIIEQLVEKYGFNHLGEVINIKCFKDNPTIKSSLTFLRKTPWARSKVESLYIEMIQKK